MRITIDIDENVLNDAINFTGEKHKSPAVAKAVEEFVRRKKAKEFAYLVRENAFDYGGDKEDEDPTNPIPPLT